MNSIEIISLVFAIVVLVKIIYVVFGNTEALMVLMRRFYQNRILPSVFLLILLAVVGGFLLSELGIVQIFAAALFGMLLYGLVLVQYPKELIAFAESVLEHKSKALLPWTLFVILASWVLYDLVA